MSLATVVDSAKLAKDGKLGVDVICSKCSYVILVGMRKDHWASSAPAVLAHWRDTHSEDQPA